MGKNSCPICFDNLYSVKKSLYVCDYHSNWLVTRCSNCKRMCFSDCKGMCTKCCPYQPRTLVGAGKDHRAVLRQYGLENYE